MKLLGFVVKCMNCAHQRVVPIRGAWACPVSPKHKTRVDYLWGGDGEKSNVAAFDPTAPHAPTLKPVSVQLP